MAREIGPYGLSLVTGFSMGGYFAHHVGCMRSDIRAVVAHSGGTHELAACPVARKPIILFHGDADDVIPDGCDDPHASNTPAGFTPSATAWARRNGCADTVHTVSVTKGTCSTYDGCPADGQVVICVLAGMGERDPARVGVLQGPRLVSRARHPHAATSITTRIFSRHCYRSGPAG